MDTRNKIIDLRAAIDLVSKGDVRIVMSLFDSLLAQHVEWLAAVKDRRLLAAVTNSEETVLSLAARAELAAALQAIDAVVPLNEEDEAVFLRAVRRHPILDGRADETSRAADLLKHVRGRHS